MTRKIRFNVAGDPHGDQPSVQPDNRTPAIPCVFEAPNRLATVDIPVLSTGGATVFYQQSQKAFRIILPPLGQFELEASDPKCIPPEYGGDVDKVALHYGPVTIVRPSWDGTYLRHPDGRRYVARHLTGFLDYKLFLDGGDVRSLWQQSQDLGVRGRRVFPHIVNIVDFNPDAYGQSYWDRLPEFIAVAAEYDQEIDFPVLSDAGYRGWSLAKCQDFWNHFCATVLNTCWLSLTNEFDHGGNLVGSPNDYNRPSDPLVSQGSAVSDAPPPRPGWGSREFHVQKPFPKIGLCEDMYFNRLGVDASGAQWGPILPTRLTEGPRFSEDTGLYTPWLASCLAYQSLAYGDGLTQHCEDSKYSRLLGPNQAACTAAAMRVLAAAEL